MEARIKKFKDSLKKIAERTGMPESSISGARRLEIYKVAEDSVRKSEKYRAIEESLETEREDRRMDRAQTLDEIATDRFPYSRISSWLIGELSKRGAKVTEIDFKEVPDGLRGSIILKEPGSIRPDERIESPSLRLTGIGFDEGELLKYTRAFISEWLYNAARERLDPGLGS